MLTKKIVQPPRVNVCVLKVARIQDAAEKSDVRPDSRCVVLGEGSRESRDRFGAIAPHAISLLSKGSYSFGTVQPA